jgi:hypothetical protein
MCLMIMALLGMYYVLTKDEFYLILAGVVCLCMLWGGVS